MSFENQNQSVSKTVSGFFCFCVLGIMFSVLVLLVTAKVTLERSDWLAGEMSLTLIYDFGSVHENLLECLGETGIKQFWSCRFLANAEEHDVMSLNGVVEYACV